MNGIIEIICNGLPSLSRSSAFSGACKPPHVNACALWLMHWELLSQVNKFSLVPMYFFTKGQAGMKLVNKSLQISP